MTSQPKLDFLADRFAAVPDYVEDEVTKEAPVKKQRWLMFVHLSVHCWYAVSDLAALHRSGGDDDKGLSSPSSSSGRTGRGRGRGRTRGRGSVRISGQDSQRGAIKVEQQDSISTHVNMSEAQEVRQQDAAAAGAVSSGGLSEPNSTLKDCSIQQTSVPASPHAPQAGQAAAFESAAIPATGNPASGSDNKPGGAADQQQQPGFSSLATGNTDDLALRQPAQASSVTIEPHPSVSASQILPSTAVDMLPEEDDYDADE